MSSTLNPYAAPAARVDDVAVHPEAETIRRAHIGHETSIRAVGPNGGVDAELFPWRRAETSLAPV